MPLVALAPTASSGAGASSGEASSGAVSSSGASSSSRLRLRVQQVVHAQAEGAQEVVARQEVVVVQVELQHGRLAARDTEPEALAPLWVERLEDGARAALDGATVQHTVRVAQPVPIHGRQAARLHYAHFKLARGQTPRLVLAHQLGDVTQSGGGRPILLLRGQR